MILWKNGNYVFISPEQRGNPGLPVNLFGTGHETVNSADYIFDNERLSRYHKGEVFQLTLKGTGWYSESCRERMHPVPAGCAFLASPEVPFCYRHRGNDPWEFIYLTFTGPAAVSLFRKWREENGSLIPLADPGKIIKRTKELQEDLNGRDVKDFRSNSRTAYELLLLIDASIARAKMDPSVRKQTEEMIKKSLTSASVDKLAALWGYEPHYFITWLRQNTGITPGKLIREVQLESAAEYLIHSARNIAAIAELCGFEDPGLFSRSFRKQYGCPPREFRKRKRAPILGEPVFLTKEEKS